MDKGNASFFLVTVMWPSPELLLGDAFYAMVREIFAQENIYVPLHGVLASTLLLDDKQLCAFANDLTKESFGLKDTMMSIPPYPKALDSLYPLGGCKLVSTVIGTLGSRYTVADKEKQRNFSSKSLRPDLMDWQQGNARENVLAKEFARAKELITASAKANAEQPLDDIGISLVVKLVDGYAQRHPKEVDNSSQGHDGHFAHTFNMVITKGALTSEMEDQGASENFQVLVFSAYKGNTIRNWLRTENKARVRVADPGNWLARFHELEISSEWTETGAGAIYEELFDVKLPKLGKKKWPIDTHVEVLLSLFRRDDIEKNYALWKCENWYDPSSCHSPMMDMLQNAWRLS